MSTIATTEAEARDRVVYDFYERTFDLGRTDTLGHATDGFTTGLEHVITALHEGGQRDTAAPGDVVSFIDELSRALHEIRSEAVGEARRRSDADMASSGKLLEQIIAEREANGGTR